MGKNYAVIDSGTKKVIIRKFDYGYYSIIHQNTKHRVGINLRPEAVGNCQIGAISGISGLMYYVTSKDYSKDVLELVNTFEKCTYKKLYLCNDTEDSYKKYKDFLAPAIVAKSPSFKSTNGRMIRNFTINSELLIKCLEARINEKSKSKDPKEKAITKES